MARRRTGGRGGARPGAGAKPKPPEERRRNRMVLHLTDEELDVVMKAARDRAVTTFAREVLLGALRKRRAR